MRITDTILPYRGFGNCESICRLRVYERQGDYPRHADEDMAANGLLRSPSPANVVPPQPAARVIVLTELPENDGTSVTNMMHRLATAIFYSRDLMGFPADVDELHLPLFQTVVVEHYPPDIEMANNDWEGYGDDRFAFVDFALIAWDNAKSYHAYADPNWRHTTKTEIETLIGGEWIR